MTYILGDAVLGNF